MTFTLSLGYTPVFALSQGGTNITAGFQDRLVMLKVESQEGGGDADKVDVTLDDRDWAIASQITYGPNAAKLGVSLGYLESSMYDQGTFEISKCYYSGPPRSIRFQGSSIGMTTAGKAPMITSFENKTVTDLITAIGQSLGVSVSVDPALGSLQIPFLNQHSSNMHMLQDLERTFNGLAKVQDGVLSFTARGTGNSATGKFIGGVNITPEDLGSWNVEEQVRTGFSKVRAAYRDPTTNQLTWVTSTNQPYTNSTVPFLIKRAFASQAEAQAGANAKMDALNRGIRQGQITLAKGDPSIRGGSIVVISGMRDGIDGSFTVRRAIHTLTKREGLTTTLDIYDPGTGSDFSSEIDPNATTPTSFGDVTPVQPTGSTTPGSGTTATTPGHP